MKRALFFILPTSILLISCEGQTTIQKELFNNTSSTLYIEQVSEFSNFSDTSIHAGQSIVISYEWWRGGQSDPGDPHHGIDTLILHNGIDTVQKNYQINTNWSIHSDQQRKVPSTWHHEMKFRVNDSDF